MSLTLKNCRAHGLDALRVCFAETGKIGKYRSRP